MSELLPCPFCGSDMVMLNENKRHQCGRCDAEGPSRDISDWNCRADSVRPIDGAVTNKQHSKPEEREPWSGEQAAFNSMRPIESPCQHTNAQAWKGPGDRGGFKCHDCGLTDEYAPMTKELATLVDSMMVIEPVEK